jgi:hypothetical protein
VYLSGNYVDMRFISADSRVTTRTVAQWLHDGLLPYVKPGPRCVLIPQPAYEQFKARRAEALS